MSLQEGSPYVNKPGNRRLSARKLNALERRVNVGLRSAPGQMVKSNPAGAIVVQFPPDETRSTGLLDGAVAVAKLVAVLDDVLTVNFVDADGTVSSEEVEIAKPYKLRWTPFHNKPPVDGLVYNYQTPSKRRVTMPAFLAFTGTEEIRPKYNVGAELIVAAVGGKQLDMLDPTVPTKWIDLNVDGRAWAIRGFAQAPV